MTETINRVTFWIFVSFWPIWLCWEIALLVMRGFGWTELPGTISMIARDRGWQMNAVVYVWCGLAAHFWWTSDKWATNAGTAVFWAIAAALLIQDVAMWALKYQDVALWPMWLRFQRWPLAWMVLGALAGRFLFPQVGRNPWQ